jgi:ABC-type lipoprotein release transport system permease subunit
LSGVLESRLFGVAALDPASYLGASLLLAAVAALACSAPARSAAGADPASTLRGE